MCNERGAGLARSASRFATRTDLKRQARHAVEYVARELCRQQRLRIPRAERQPFHCY